MKSEVSHCGFTVPSALHSADLLVPAMLHIHSECLELSFTHNQLSECTLHRNVSAVQTALHHCNRNLS